MIWAALSYRQSALERALGRRQRGGRACHLEPRRRDTAGALFAHWPVDLTVRLEVGRSHHAGGGGGRRGHPPSPRGPQGTSLLERLEEQLHPWIALAILPLFAFANAGVSLAGLTLAKLLAPMPLGIVAGLVIGEPLGILAASRLAQAGGLAQKPTGAHLATASGCWHARRCRLYHEPIHRQRWRSPIRPTPRNCASACSPLPLCSVVAGYLVLRFSAPARP
jgi:Na+/H+ antiporter 1